MENVIESALIRVPISKLVISSLNVRKKQGTGIEELAALIAAQGLIHNLVVTEQIKKGKKTGKYEVVAGGRRLEALKLLVSDGRLAKEHEVDCKVVGPDEALELSLAENSGREGMHPADLVMAYRNLTQAGLSPDEIAPRFGVSPLTVKRYLKLTSVSPAIFKLYAEDKMNFEQISALALTDDHELQERIWNNTPTWQRNGATFRRLITETEINIRTSPLARFVGVEAYEAGGGLIRRDLFGNENDGYMQDAELLERLALEKLAKTESQVREEGFAWVECRTAFDYSDLTSFGRVRTVTRQPTEEEQALLESLQAELEAIEQEIDSYDEDADADSEAGEDYAVLEEKYDAARKKLENLIHSMEEPDVGDLALAGAIVTIDHEGRLRIERGLIRKEDMKRLSSDKAVPGIAGTTKADEPKPVHSEKLTRMLAAQRTAAIQAAIASRPDVALVAIVHRLALQVFSNGYVPERVVQIHMERPHLKNDAEDIGQSLAAVETEKKRCQWAEHIEAAGQGGHDLFSWLLEQPQQDLLDLLAFCVSASVNTVSGRENVPSPEVSRLMQAVNLDMADWWQPTADNYLSHVSKDRIIEVVAQVVSPEVAATLTKLKKSELVGMAEAKLVGLRWVPDNLKCAEQPK